MNKAFWLAGAIALSKVPENAAIATTISPVVLCVMFAMARKTGAAFLKNLPGILKTS